MKRFNVTNLNSVDSILSDFKRTVENLMDLAARKELAIQEREQRISQLGVENTKDIVEKERALSAAAKINAILN